jgi:regulator of sirC expression with transglutaminase-like and TPR domain
MAEWTFQDELHQEPIHLPRAALRFARELAYPDLEIEAYLDRLDRLAETGRKIYSTAGSPRERAEALADFLFDRSGFQGNANQYDDPRNSYLNEVLDRRLGIPISLSVVYLYVAQRLGLAAYGVGLPGHFIVGVEDPQGPVYLDPFHGGQRLAEADCANLVLLTGYSQAFQREWLNPTPALDILARMLNNLRNIYIQGEDWEKAASVVQLLRLIHPQAPEFARDLGLFYHRGGSFQRAIDFYREYLGRSPQAADADNIRRNLQAAVQSLARLN